MKPVLPESRCSMQPPRSAEWNERLRSVAGRNQGSATKGGYPAAASEVVPFPSLALFSKKRCAICQKALCGMSQAAGDKGEENVVCCVATYRAPRPVRCGEPGDKTARRSSPRACEKRRFAAFYLRRCSPASWSGALWPALGGVFPAHGSGWL